jgi:hypothetical protein
MSMCPSIMLFFVHLFKSPSHLVCSFVTFINPELLNLVTTEQKYIHKVKLVIQYQHLSQNFSYIYLIK